MSDAQDLFIGINRISRACVPAYERVKHLYALGYSNGQIAQTIADEFQDLEASEISHAWVREIIKNNREAFDKYRMELSSICANQQKTHTINMFNLTQSRELRVVEIYNAKISDALDELQDLSLNEQDEKGNFKNTNRIFILMELIEKFHKKCSEFIGTAAMREIEIYRQKMEIKSKSEKVGGLVPTYNEDGTKEVGNTKFID
jgi:hypothetical protein